jgi:sulfur carrier protein
VIVNGQHADILAGQTVEEVLVDLGLEASARGIAVAVDGEVVPRAEWGARALGKDSRVEVLTAMQGG